MKVIVNNNIYDITTFIPEHPGGNAVFQNNDIADTNVVADADAPEEIRVRDLTLKFNEVGHSEYAVNLLGNYKIGEISEDDPRFRRDYKLEYNKNKISKLVTHEDKFHIHKTMGVISLLNYFYLFFDCFYSGATATLTIRKVDSTFIGLTWLHSALSLSALQFLIPRTRTGILPMIWQEFRAHSIIFAVRSFLIINMLYFSMLYPVNPNPNPDSIHKTPPPQSLNPGTNIIAHMLIRTTSVLLSMKLADISTRQFRENRKETTTATMPYWSNCNPRLQTMIKYFYTHSQFMATTACLFSHVPYILAVAFPIQVASFLMTLVRKNIISAFWYHVLYGGSLLTVYLINAADVKLYIISVIGIFMIYARVNARMNKYVLWILTSFVGCLIQYATSNARYYEKVRIFILLAPSVIIPAATIYAFHFKGSTPVTIFGLWIHSYLFDKTARREESNHRVVSNTVSSPTSTFNRIVIHMCETYQNYKPGMYFNLYFDTLKRPYTPVEFEFECGTTLTPGDTATFLIKRTHGGEVSPLLCDKYRVNQTVFIKGPFGRKYYDPSPGVQSFICDGKKIDTPIILMCSCGSGITPFYSMGMSWLKCGHFDRHQIHFLSSYRDREDAILRVQREPVLQNEDAHDPICESLFISNENMKLTPGRVIDYLSSLVDGLPFHDSPGKESIRVIKKPNRRIVPSDISVFICGTRAYSEMIKESCSIYSNDILCYDW
jgi:ferredoxin-NADP reductase